MIRTNDFHCDTFASSSATQQRINTSDQPCDNDARKKYRAFRISSIPIVVDINTFRDYLETLAHDGSSGRYENAVTVSNIRSLTLVPHGRGKIATVVFHVVPRQLEESSPGAPVEIEFDHNGTRCRLTVDCDFFGMTPYYSSGDDAAVECAGLPLG